MAGPKQSQSERTAPSTPSARTPEVIGRWKNPSFVVFNSALFLAGVGGMFFRMARDNDDLIRAALVVVAGSACTLILAAGRLRVPAAIAAPCLGWALALFLSSFATVNPGESLKEFMKTGVYLLVFLTLAATAGRESGLRRTAGWWKIPLALLLLGALLGRVHAYGLFGMPPLPLWSGGQVALSIFSTLILGAAFVFFVERDGVRRNVIRGLWIMAALACAIGIMQFYGIDPLRPWDPRQPYNIYVRNLPADILTFLGSITPGQLRMDAEGLVLVLPRILGIYGNPDFFAPYLLQFIPLAIAVTVLDPARRRFGALMTALLLVTLYLTQVWGAFFSLIVLAPFFVALLGFVSGRISWPKAVRLTAAFLAAGILLLGLLTWILHASGRKSSAIEERLVKYRMAAEMWERSPLIGVGLNAYKSWYPVVQQDVRLQHNLPFESLGSSFTQENRTHNDIAQMLAETGAVGTGIFLWFMTALLRRAMGHLRRWRSLPAAERADACGLTGGVLLVLVYSLPNFPFHIVSSAATFWIIAGLLASYRPAPNGREPAETPPASRALPLAAAFLSVALAAMFCTRLFLGTLEYKRADTLARRTSPPDVTGAAAKYRIALELDPSNAQYAYDYGAMCFNASGTDPALGALAEPLLKRALRLGFVNEDLAYGLAYLAEKRGDSAEALDWYTMATSLNERHEPSREGRIRILLSEIRDAEDALSAGRYSQARSLYRAALERNPANHLAAYKLGTLSVTPFGDTAAGILLLKEAAKSARNEPTFYFALGRALYLGRDMAGARAALSRAVMLDPNDAEAKAALARVEEVLEGR